MKVVGVGLLAMAAGCLTRSGSVAEAGRESFPASAITAGGRPAQLDIRAAGANSVRITLKPLDFAGDFPYTPSLIERPYPDPVISLRTLESPVERRIGTLDVGVRPAPLTVVVRTAGGEIIQEITFPDDGSMTFRLDGQPVLGLGEGGPLPEAGADWRNEAVEFDRRGRLHEMRPRWQRDAYGSRNPVAVLVGTGGWAMFIATPWGSLDLRQGERGLLTPRVAADIDPVPQNRANQRQDLGKGLPPRNSFVPGVFDLFVFDAHDPAALMKDVALISGQAVLPPKWALGYMQSHRTLEDDAQMIRIVDTFREKRIPLDAVIYLGTGFTPRGWNTEQPSFAFNPEIFRRSPEEVISDLHQRNVKVVLHMVPWDRDELPTLHGSIPARAGETLDRSHIQEYWQQHLELVNQGVDGWWPDEGDWFDLFERMTRHQMYYEGPISTRPDVRPWSLHRNGHLGVARWGGWIWSGDTDSSWRSLEAQIAVGINHSLSVSPFWGSDIGGFFPNEELTGELYARWFQFGSFTSSFRSHGRTWWTRLPWGWGSSEMGPSEGPATPLLTELNNPRIEPVAKQYAELRYQLLPYNYTLAWQARETGMPMMRAMWLHYPDDARVRGLGNQYLWGRDLLIAPIFEEGATSREVHLPDGDDWYDWWTGERQPGGSTVTRAIDLATMPIYVRAGSIVPLDPIRQHTGEAVDEPTVLRVYRGADGEFTLYDDDGASLAYLGGAGNWTRMRWNDATRTLTLEPAPPEGSTNQVDPKVFEARLHPEGTSARVTYSGQAVEVEL